MDAGSHPVRRVAIVGLGLIGGSLARALGETPSPPEIAAADRDAEALSRARSLGVVDRTARDPGDIIGDCDIVIYATPLDVMLEMLPRHRDGWAPEATVSDVASLKAPVLQAMRALDADERYVGAHPMAGTEGSGFDAAAATLFRQERVWLVAPTASRDRKEAVESLWRSVGARPGWTEAAEHDHRMSWVSHAPQLAATALALVLADAGVEPEELGTGGRDAVRLAGSPPDLWRSILSEGGPGGEEALEALEERIAELRELLADGDLAGVTALLRRGRDWWTSR